MTAYNYPFLGRGLAFPFRVDPITGGAAITDGITDSASVALQYIQERWSIRENIDYVANHIAEAIAHILLTVPGEHDTLPEFGSRMLSIVFEPNSQEFRMTAKVYFETATARWEKRAKVVDTQ
jgi:phage baseplate assembly protein W